VQSLPYALNLLTEVGAISTVLGISARSVTVIDVPSSTITLAAPEPSLPTEAILAVPLSTITLAAPAPASAGPADSSYSSVSLLLHMDGSNASTTFTDNGPSVFTVTANGNSQISTAQSKFGGASGLFDGTGDYLSIPHNTAFSIHNSDFTLEAWVYRSASGVQHNILNKRDDFPSSGWGWRINSDDTLRFFYTGGSTVDSFATVSSGAWVHVAVTRSGTTVRQFIDGTEDGNVASVANGTSNSVALWIGVDRSVTNGFNGYIDDLRITKGVARYTASFTPPAAAFPNS
jgi:hypothetical protein